MTIIGPGLTTDSTTRARSPRAKVGEHELIHVGAQHEHAVSDRYKAFGTPVALAIAPDGTIETPVVGGRDKIAELVERAVSTPVAPHAALPAAGPRPAAPAPTAASQLRVDRSQRPSSRVGSPAPIFALEGVDGERHASSDLYAERTLAIFWNPSCGFCQRMVPALRAFVEARPPGAPRVVVISRGDAEAVRAQQLGSLILVDSDGGAASAFGAGGTPMGVLVEGGRIASPVAAGADAVLALAGAGTDARGDGQLAG